MAVKRKKEKKLLMEKLVKSSVKIRCKFCDLKDSCNTRESKEKSEQMGIVTFCSMTPNKSKKRGNKNAKSRSN